MKWYQKVSVAQSAFLPALMTLLADIILPNKPAPKVPNDTRRNPPFCTFISFSFFVWVRPLSIDQTLQEVQLFSWYSFLYFKLSILLFPNR